jgi:hypothetical protein
MTFVDFNEEVRSEIINLLSSNFIKNFLKESKFKLKKDVSVLLRCML